MVVVVDACCAASRTDFVYSAISTGNTRIGVGGIDKLSTLVFLGKTLQYYYIPTIGVADLQAPLNNML